MTTVNAVGTSTQTSNTSVGSAQAVDYQSFLRLLVAQMKNQDPTSPMESTDYIAQLATFSQVEQSVQMNKSLQSMIQANVLSQATGLIGRHIETMDGKFSGMVKEVQIFSDGSVLVLEDGTRVPMGASMVVREEAPVTPPEEAPVTPPTEDTETAEEAEGGEAEA